MNSKQLYCERKKKKKRKEKSIDNRPKKYLCLNNLFVGY